MSDEKILVPVDFSPSSQAALEYAAAFAKDFGAELVIVHVVDHEVEHLPGVRPNEALAGLHEALQALKPNDESAVVSHQMLEGTPADAILEFAQANNVKMIVMGTHGRTGLRRFVLGSVAEKVAREATCPVLTLRQPEDTS